MAKLHHTPVVSLSSAVVYCNRCLMSKTVFMTTSAPVLMQPNNGETLKTQSWNFRGAWQMWRGLGERSTLWNIYQVYILCIESKMGKCRGKKKRQMLSWTHSWELETDIVKAQKRPRGRYYRYKMLINSIEKKRTIISSLFCVQRQICSTWGLHCYFSFFFF